MKLFKFICSKAIYRKSTWIILGIYILISFAWYSLFSLGSLFGLNKIYDIFQLCINYMPSVVIIILSIIFIILNMYSNYHNEYIEKYLESNNKKISYFISYFLLSLLYAVILMILFVTVIIFEQCVVQNYSDFGSISLFTSHFLINLYLILAFESLAIMFMIILNNMKYVMLILLIYFIIYGILDFIVLNFLKLFNDNASYSNFSILYVLLNNNMNYKFSYYIGVTIISIICICLSCCFSNLVLNKRSKKKNVIEEPKLNN